MVAHGAGCLVRTDRDLVTVVDRLRGDPAALNRMRAASAALGRPRAAFAVADLVAELSRGIRP